jgi:hypothetical protein
VVYSRMAQKIEFPDAGRAPLFAESTSIAPNTATSAIPSKKRVLTFDETSKPISVPAVKTDQTRPVFQDGARDSLVWAERCAAHHLTEPKQIQQVRGLVESMVVGQHLSFLNFGDTLQHDVETTNSALLDWGREHLSSPLLSMAERTTSACQAFQRAMNPPKTWRFWANEPDLEQSRRSLDGAEAQIEQFLQFLRQEKPRQTEAHRVLNDLMTDTQRLLNALQLHQVAAAIRLDLLAPELAELAVEMSKGRDVSLYHQAEEAKSTLETKKTSFSLMGTTLGLQLTQVRQLMTQQRQQLLHYDQVAAVTLPLWRTHALACLTQRDQAAREQAWNAFQQTHAQLGGMSS